MENAVKKEMNILKDTDPSVYKVFVENKVYCFFCLELLLYLGLDRGHIDESCPACGRSRYDLENIESKILVIWNGKRK